MTTTTPEQTIRTDRAESRRPDEPQHPGELTQRGSLVRHSLALAQRSLIKTMRTPEALVDVTLQPVIFLAMFTYIFGGAIAGGSQHEYLQYLLPGLLGQTIAMSGIAIGQNLNSDIDKGIFDRFRSLPMARSAPLIGIVMADFVRYAILFAVMMGTGWLMGFQFTTGLTGVLGALALSVGFGLCFSWVSVWIGMKMRTPGAVQGLMFLIVLPLSFGSNVFVKTSTMPGWLQEFVNVNPITHLVDAVRGMMLGGPVAGPVLWTLVCMGCLLVVFVPLAVRAYARRT
ncbi:MAG TPA: ABC transporter permease [Segeticoccus sp.]|jgi:oleandomycin transport system permease protein|nr:ABC transporter permease [Segeticoccus sp.]